MVEKIHNSQWAVKMTPSVLKGVIDLYDSNKISQQTVINSYYRLMIEENETISKETAMFYLGDFSDLVWNGVASRKISILREKYESAVLKRRLRSAKNRRIRNGLLSQTDDGSITPETIVQKLKDQSFKCALCGVYLNKQSHKHLDHIKPVSKGGAHILSNVQWLCRKCNLSKKDTYEQ